MSKELEDIKKLLNNLYDKELLTDGDVYKLGGDVAYIEKSLKALEIIKNKGVNVGLFLYCISGEDEDSVKIYNSYKLSNESELTKEEYELLKEVLL